MLSRHHLAARRPRRFAPRAGLSLAEVIVVLVVLGIAAAAVGRIAVRQQAHYRDVTARTQTRSGLREGTAVLAAELRGIAPAAGDLYASEMQDASVAFRSTVGTYLLCGAAAAGASAIDVVSVPALAASAPSQPDGNIDDNAPSPGDSLWLYDSGATTGGTDDRWKPLLVTGVTHTRRSCLSAQPTDTRDVFRLTLSTLVQANPEPHAPVRLFRRVRYALYRSSDGLWYLGFSDCRPVVRSPPCAALQPVSGPYQPYSAANAGTASGLVLRYLDRAGAPTSKALDVAAVEMVFRARVNAANRLAWASSERQTIAFRNIRR